MKLPKFLLGLAGALALATVATAQTPSSTTFTASLSGASERPAKVDTKGSGTVMAVLSGHTLVLGASFDGLSGPATAAHIHGPADPEHAAGVLVPLAVSPAAKGQVGGLATLSDEQVDQLKQGMMYVNIHTDANKGGEVRGQLSAAK